MTITLPLQPREEAQIRTGAEARGQSPESVICEALAVVLADRLEANQAPALAEEREALPIRDVIAHYMSDVPPGDFAQLPEDDYYLYGHVRAQRTMKWAQRKNISGR